MRDGPRTRSFDKDSASELLLQRLNMSLSPLEAELTEAFDYPRLPIFFVVGPPRSGTTLLSQLLVSTGAFSYASNLVARFWEAPYVALRLQQALGLEPGHASNLRSRLGITDGILEPHEFGYFWGRWFDFGETHKLLPEQLARIDTAGLRRELAAMESVYERPLLFKNLTCGLQIGFLARMLPTAVFVLCRRALQFTIQSILLSREAIYGSRYHWFSVRPGSYRGLLHLPPLEQIAAQVTDTLDEINTELSNLVPHRRVVVDYEQICAEPRNAIGAILSRLGLKSPDLDRALASVPESLTCANVRRLEGEEWDRLVRIAAEHSESLSR